MNNWGDADALVALLDRQFGYLAELRGTIQIVRLKRLIKFLRDEPRITGILQDLKLEGREALDEYDAADAAIRRDLAALWETHGTAIVARLANENDDDLGAYGDLAGFARRLAQSRSAHFGEPHSDSQHTRTYDLIMATNHWWKYASDLATKESEPFPPELSDVADQLKQLHSKHWHAGRKLAEANRSLAWPAYERIVSNATLTNPSPPLPDDDLAWYTHPQKVKFAQTLDAVDDGTAVARVDRVGALYEAIKADARLLHEELRLRIGLGRSRVGLVKRYAAGCEAFHADRLRCECEADSGNAERILTLDLARFLFEAGLSPLIDATTSGLRPDILHVGQGSLFYVEAKQYDQDHPHSQLKKAYRQVWGTWGRLRKTHPTTEAFLVVFRRGGPWVELPEVVTHDGLKLYSVVVDISTSAGCKEKLPIVRLNGQDLVPSGEEQ